MNNNRKFLRREIAFAAALVFVSQVFTSSTTSFNHSASAVELNCQDIAETISKGEESPNTTTYQIEIENENSAEAFSWVSFDEFAKQVFQEKPFETNNTEHEITVGSDIQDISKEIFFGDKVYKLYSSIDNVITYVAYYKFTDNATTDKKVSLDFDDDDILENSYYKAGSYFYLTPDKRFLADGNSEPIKILNNDFLSFNLTENTDGTFSVNISNSKNELVSTHGFTYKTFNIADSDKFDLKLNGKSVSSKELRWCDLERISLDSGNNQAIIVSDGTNSKIVNVKNNPFFFYHVFESSGLESYNQGTTYSIETVKNSLTSTVYIDDIKSDIEFSPVEIENTNGDFILKIPYFADRNIVLESYDYDGNTVVSASDIFDKISNGDKYLSIDYSSEIDTITLNYKTVPYDKNFTLQTQDSISKRGENLYTFDSSASEIRLFNSSEYADRLVFLDYTGVPASKPVLHSDVCRVNSDGSQNFAINWDNFNSPTILILQNILGYDQKNDRIVSSLSAPLTFYKDTSAPVVSVDISGESNWENRKSTKFDIDITDFEPSPFDSHTETLSDDEQFIDSTYKEIINADSTVFSEISEIRIGCYTFRRPENGWNADISGVYESGDYRKTKEEIIELIRELILSDFSDSFLSNRKTAEGILENQTKLNSLLNNSTSVEKSSVLRQKLTEFQLIDNTNPLDYDISLHFNEDDGNFTVSASLKKDTEEAIIEDSLDISAFDCNGNQSNTVTRKISIDNYIPKTTPEQISVLDAFQIDDDYVLHENSSIEVSIDEKGSGTAEVMLDISGGKTPTIKMTDVGNGIYRHVFSAEEIKNTNLKNPICIQIIDSAGNESSIVTTPYNVIIDTQAPESTIKKLNSADFTSANGSEWYSDYSSANLSISAFDDNRKLASGLHDIELNVNGIISNLNLIDYNISVEDLRNGRYYISFMPLSKTGTFRADLRNSANSDFVVKLFESNGNSGRISVELTAHDNSGNASEPQKIELYADTQAPIIKSVSTETTALMNNLDALKFEFFADSEIPISITVEDNAPSSGIKQIEAVLLNADGTEADRFPFTFSSENSTENCTIRIPANFRGRICVTAADNSGNISDKYSTVGIVTEDGFMHTQTSYLSVELPPTSYTDINGRPLYRNDVTARVAVCDDFSGISEVTLNASGCSSSTVKIDSNGFLSGNEADEWEISQTYDFNLVHEISRNITVSENSNANTIMVGLRDNAGNPHNTEFETAEFSIDKTSPSINVDFVDSANSADTKYKTIYKSPRKAVISINERNFSPDLAKVTVNGTQKFVTWKLAGGQKDTDSAVYQAEITFSEDGTYVLSVECKDLCGHEAEKVVCETFTIDRTPAIVTPTSGFSDSENQNYGSDVNVTFSIVDDNFDPERIVISGTFNNKKENFSKNTSWVNNGDKHTASMKFEKDGDYTISITGQDSAGNDIQPYSNEFSIDTEKPEIKLKNVSPANSSDEIRPLLIFIDPHLNSDNITIKLDGAKRGKDLAFTGNLIKSENGYEFKFDNFLNSETYDDIYTITATAKDDAGNETTEKFQFSVNRFGSTFILDDTASEISGKCISDIPDVIIREINVDEHGGIYSVLLSINGKITELIDGKDYEVHHIIGADSWSEYKYIISPKNFIKDADYTISIHSVDKAGNLNISDSESKKAELSFTVDRTLPFLVPANISSNSSYHGKEYAAHFDVSDNVQLNEVKAFINGEQVESNLVGNDLSFNIPSSKHPYFIKVAATDIAGNSTELTYNNVIVTNNSFKYLLNRTWFKATVAALLTITAGITSLVLIRKRRKDNELW